MSNKTRKNRCSGRTRPVTLLGIDFRSITEALLCLGDDIVDPYLIGKDRSAQIKIISSRLALDWTAEEAFSMFPRLRIKKQQPLDADQKYYVFHKIEPAITQIRENSCDDKSTIHRGYTNDELSNIKHQALNSQVKTDEISRFKNSYEILIGEAGHNLVLSRLQSWLTPAQSAMPGLPYDILADIADIGIVRLQVKTCTRMQGKRYSFNMKRGFYGSAHGVFDYEIDDYDIAAFVCLPLSKICFIAAPIQRFSAPAAKFMTQGIEKDTLGIAIKTIRRQRSHSQQAFAIGRS